MSAYKNNHLTGTNLLMITNVIATCTNMEEKLFTVLDLSAAFDTFDYAALIKLLSSGFDISEKALDLILSYLYDRGQTYGQDRLKSIW